MILDTDLKIGKQEVSGRIYTKKVLMDMLKDLEGRPTLVDMTDYGLVDMATCIGQIKSFALCKDGVLRADFEYLPTAKFLHGISGEFTLRSVVEGNVKKRNGKFFVENANLVKFFRKDH